MNFYTSLFSNSKIDSLTCNKDGLVMQALLTLNGQICIGIDSNVKRDFTFTPAISLYVNCKTEDEVDNLFFEVIRRRQAVDAYG